MVGKNIKNKRGYIPVAGKNGRQVTYAYLDLGSKHVTLDGMPVSTSRK